MVKTLTLKTDIPADRELNLKIQLPQDLAPGPAEIALVVVTTQPEEKAVGEPYAWIDYCLQHPVDFGRTDMSTHIEEFTGRRF